MSKSTDSEKGAAKGIVGEYIMYVLVFLLTILFIMFVSAIFSDSAAKLIGYSFCIEGVGDSKIKIIQLLGGMISVVLAVIGSIVLIRWINATEEAMDTIGKWVALSATFLFIVLLVLFVLFIFSDYTEEWVKSTLNANTEENKIAIIELLGWMMSGVLAVVGVVGLNRRAEAQVKDNKLVEKGHTQERAKTAAKHLGHDKASVRIAAFYEFVQLANDNKKRRESILKILYAHIRATTTDSKYDGRVLMTGKPKPTEEIQGLLDGLFKFNEIERGDVEINLQRSYLSGADLVKVNLSKANLFRADLSEANLHKANLFEANLSEVKLHKAKLSEAGLLEADLSGAKLPEADLSKANLHKADLSEANLHRADLSEANLFEVNLSKADLFEANLPKAVLIGAYSPGVNLSEAYLYKANLSKAHLSRADLSGANLPEADLSGAYLPEADLSKADLRKANLSGAKLPGAKLPEADLSGADLSGADLFKANLSEADLSGADLSGANLSGTDLSGADLFRADLSGARLENASYTNETKFPKWLEEWLESQQINPDNDGKKYVPAGFVASTSPRIGE